jgi:pimeloyl-ACP methyl ester carboxylesterase
LRGAADGTYGLDDGSEIHFLSFGDPAAPTAVVVPGLTDGLAPVFDPDGAEAVRPPARPFRNLRVLVISHRTPMPDTWGTEQMAADLAAFLRDVSGPAHLVGHSMGGMVGQHAAASHPDLVRRLVMSSTVPSADPHFRQVLDRWDAHLRAGRWRCFYRDAVDASFAGSARWWRRVAVRASSTGARPTALVRRHLVLSTACREHDATGSLGRISAPTLVLAGSRDQVTRPERAREIADGVPGARLVVIEGAGHGLPDQRRRVYARAVSAFLAETGS